MKDGPIYARFRVRRTDKAERDPGSKHYGGCAYFVLDLSHDPAAIPALAAYVDAIRATHPMLADDLTATWLNPEP